MPFHVAVWPNNIILMKESKHNIGFNYRRCATFCGASLLFTSANDDEGNNDVACFVHASLSQALNVSL